MSEGRFTPGLEEVQPQSSTESVDATTDVQPATREQVQTALDELTGMLQTLELERAALSQNNYEGYANKHRGFESKIQQVQAQYNSLETNVASQQVEGNIFKKNSSARTELRELYSRLESLKEKYYSLRPGIIFAVKA